ncbi:MAG: DUF4199 domain-containing protein [Acidobacteria bacterium]|nr:MAG: DUF4199 domain-containing protein [Acidobacteriota bacterium]
MTAVQWRALALAGLVAGLVQVAAGVTMYLAGVYFAPWSALVNLVVLAACIVAGNVWSRTHVFEGRTTYLRALLVGVVIAVSTGLVYITYNVVSVSFVHPHFLEDMVQARFAARQAMALDPSGASQALHSLRAETTLGLIVANNFRFLCVTGTVLSALIAVPLAFIGKRSSGTAAAGATTGARKPQSLP